LVWYTHSCYFNELKPAKVRCNSASFSFLNIGLFISHNKIAKWFWCQQDSNLDRRSRRYVSTVAPWPLPTVQKFFFIFSPFSVNAFFVVVVVRVSFLFPLWSFPFWETVVRLTVNWFGNLRNLPIPTRSDLSNASEKFCSGSSSFKTPFLDSDASGIWTLRKMCF